MPDYLLTINIKSSHPDDPSARDAARRVLDDMQMLGEHGKILLTSQEKVKLQEIFLDKPPRTIAIE